MSSCAWVLVGKKKELTVGSRPDYVKKKFGPLKKKTLKSALAHRIHQDFPRIGGPRIRNLCAEMILDVVNEHLLPRERLTHGQVLWMGISIDTPPRRHQTIADVDLVPVVLDLSTHDDIDCRIERKTLEERLLKKVIRLCEQAYSQEALLSNCDLAEILGTNDSRIARLLAAHERRTGRVVPRRATLHDVGTGITHKSIICRKRYVEGKESHQIAAETYHSLEAVDSYLGQYDRVRHCRLQGLTPHETAHALSCTLGLVAEYLKIDSDLEVQDE